MSVSKWLRDPATPHDAVLNLVTRRWRQVQNGKFELCVALRRLYEDCVHRHEGYARFVDYADQRLGMREKLANTLCFVGKHLKRLPKTTAALESGDLTYTKAREFAKIATPDDEEAWIEFAMTHTNRDLERECKRARCGTEHDEKRITSTVKPQQVPTVRKARELAMKLLDKPVPEAELLPVMSELFVNGTNLPTGPGSKPEPYLTVNLCPRCTHTYVPTPGENLRVPIEDWFEALKNGAEVHDLVADVLCDCEGVKHRRDRCPHAHARPAKGESPPKNRHIPVDVRRRIEARDGHRCRVPGCGNPVPLELSHLKPYRDGTPGTPANVSQHCATCNVLIETGRLRVEGEAPLEKYYRAGRGFAGYGFDPSPHVGKSLAHFANGDSDPPGVPPYAE